MKTNEVKCPTCGSKDVEIENDLAKCKHCGTQFLINSNETIVNNISNNIKAENVYVSGESKKIEGLMNSLESAKESGNISSIIKLCEKILEIDPENKEANKLLFNKIYVYGVRMNIYQVKDLSEITKYIINFVDNNRAIATNFIIKNCGCSREFAATVVGSIEKYGYGPVFSHKAAMLAEEREIAKKKEKKHFWKIIWITIAISIAIPLGAILGYFIAL